MQQPSRSISRLTTTPPVPEPIWIEDVSPPRDELGDPAAMEPFLRMFFGTFALLEEKTTTSVGEVFVVANSKRGFHYEQQGSFSANNEQEIGPEWTTLNWGTAAQGGFGFNLLPPKEHGVGAIGFSRVAVPPAGIRRRACISSRNAQRILCCRRGRSWASDCRSTTQLSQHRIPEEAAGSARGRGPFQKP